MARVQRQVQWRDAMAISTGHIQRGYQVRRSMTAAVVVALVGAVVAGLGATIATPMAARAALGARSDFNCDGFSDLAVGVPGKAAGVGAVEVFFGSDAGLAPNATVLSIGTAGATGLPTAGDRFGAAISVGHFDGDTCDDLAVGAPGVDIGAVSDAGAVYIFFGSGAGFAANRTARITRGSKGVPSANQAGAQFGSVLASGDSNGDFIDDLAIGAPLDDGSTTTNSGSVTVISAPGTVGGGSYNAQWFRPGLNGMVGLQETNAFFGAALSFGNFAVADVSDFSEELAIGAPGTNADGWMDSGAVYVLRNGVSGLITANSAILTQNSPGVPGSSEKGDGFGFSLTSAKLLGNDVHDDLAIGAPAEDVGTISDAGVVTVLGGSPNGLADIAAPAPIVLYQGAAGVPDRPEAGDRFGQALDAANFSSNAADVDLAISASSEDAGSGVRLVADVGTVDVVRSVNGNLSSVGAQSLTQSFAGVPGASEAGDNFGLFLAAGDFHGTGSNDLAVGVPYEDVGPLVNAGAVTVLDSDGTRLNPSASGAAVITLDSPGVPGASQPHDGFGIL